MVRFEWLGAARTAITMRSKRASHLRRRPKLLAHGREHGVGCIASAPGQVVAPHPVLVFEVTDRGLHGRAPAERAFDGSSEPSLLTCHVDLEALVLRCVVALVPGVGDDPLERLHVGDKLAALQRLRGVATLTLTPNS